MTVPILLCLLLLVLVSTDFFGRTDDAEESDNPPRRTPDVHVPS